MRNWGIRWTLPAAATVTSSKVTNWQCSLSLLDGSSQNIKATMSHLETTHHHKHSKLVQFASRWSSQLMNHVPSVCYRIGFIFWFAQGNSVRRQWVRTVVGPTTEWIQEFFDGGTHGSFFRVVLLQQRYSHSNHDRQRTNHHQQQKQ